MSRVVYGAVCGALSGLGLAVSGMTNPDKVLNFLDVTGRWDPSLALALLAALAVSVPGFAWVRRRGRSFTGTAVGPEPAAPVDRHLVVGSALFGVGIGIAGYGLGPGLANLGYGTLEAAVFVLALLVGSQLARFLSPRR